MWNVTNTKSTWTGDVKVLPSLNGEDSYPNSYSWMQLTFEPAVKDGKVQDIAHVTANLTRDVDYKSEGFNAPPTCVTKYSYTCLKSTSLTITPVCNYLDGATATECGCTSGGTNCKESTAGSGCYFFADPLAVHEKCTTPCTGFFWCERFLLSYETTTFSLIIEKDGKLVRPFLLGGRQCSDVMRETDKARLCGRPNCSTLFFSLPVRGLRVRSNMLWSPEVGALVVPTNR